MSQSALRISAEDLSRRLERRGTGDEIDRLADTLNAMLARLQAAFGEMQRFAADAAHELRTPLTALKGGVEIALRAERPAEEYRRVLASSLEEVDQLIRLAEDLLLLSRSTADLTAARRPVDLEPLCLEAFEVGVRLVKGKGVTVRMGPTLPVVTRGDAGALRRALLNLVDNAVKYTPAGGGVTISLSAGPTALRSSSRTQASGLMPPMPSASSSPSCGSTPAGAATPAEAGSASPSPVRSFSRTAARSRSRAARAPGAASRSGYPRHSPRRRV